MVSGSRRLLALGAVVALALLAGCDGGAFNRVCTVCEGNALPNEDYGAVENSTVDVQLTEDGAGHWTATVEMAATHDVPSADGIRETLHGESENRYVPIYEGDARNVSVQRGAGEFRVSFTVEEMARRTDDGRLLVTYFNGINYDHSYRLGTDRFRVHAPPGTAISNSPPGATVRNGSTAVWRGDDTELSGELFLVVDDDRTAVTRGRAKLLIAQLAVERGGPRTATLAVPGSLVVGGMALWLVGRRGDGPVRRQLLGSQRKRRRFVPGVVLAVAVVLVAVVARLPAPVSLTVYAEMAVVGLLAIGLTVGTVRAASRDHWSLGPLLALLAMVPLYPAGLIGLRSAYEGGGPTIVFWAYGLWVVLVVGGSGAVLALEWLIRGRVES